jgi:hypothetical protein
VMIARTLGLRDASFSPFAGPCLRDGKYNLSYAQNGHPERWSRSADAVRG